MFQVHTVYFLSQSWISHFSKEPCFLVCLFVSISGNGIRNQDVGIIDAISVLNS